MSIDLENLIVFLKANNKSVWFDRKRYVFNMKTQCSVGEKKEKFCAIWYKGMRDRSGNDTASGALIACFVAETPSSAKIALWSDSCVAQNKNSMMSLTFM